MCVKAPSPKTHHLLVGDFGLINRVLKKHLPKRKAQIYEMFFTPYLVCKTSMLIQEVKQILGLDLKVFAEISEIWVDSHRPAAVSILVKLSNHSVFLSQISSILHFRKLTWNPKIASFIDVSLFSIGIFRFISPFVWLGGVLLTFFGARYRIPWLLPASWRSTTLPVPSTSTRCPTWSCNGFWPLGFWE